MTALDVTSEPLPQLEKTWEYFDKIIRPRGNLLKRLPEFPDSILVTGCQRSGTTILSVVISESKGMSQYVNQGMLELEGALILAGITPHESVGRYCFQTTYVNECYREYFENMNGRKIIWVLRNPYSTVYSMLHHWAKASFNALFKGCGSSLLKGLQNKIYRFLGQRAIPRLKRGCLSYNSKLSQLFELKKNLPPGTIKVVEYDELIKSKRSILPLIYDDISLEYNPVYADRIHSRSLKKKNRLSRRETYIIQDLCLPFYRQALDLVNFSSKILD